MPPKKKKVPLSPDRQDGDQELVDVFSYLELVGDCLDRAESSQTACLEGIINSDITLTHSRGDADIGFIVLMKRAELLYIAVKHSYDTSDLSDQHSNPLVSCIKDCETILKSVSSDDQASKSIYEKAKTLYTNAMQLSKASERSSRAQATAESARDSQRVFKQYNPTKTLFKHISKINPYLLQDVVNCYRNSKLFCRRCYYKQKRQVALSTSLHCLKCKKTVQPLLLMPASKMCQNLNQSKVVAIPSPPKTMMSKFNKHKPFQMCRNNDHSGCYEKSATGDTWFAHSIEELVIWTVERHYDCTFKEYVARYHKDSDPPNLSLFSSTTGRAEIDHYRDRSSVSTDETEYEYYPEECLFYEVASIPQRLLLDIIECYRLVKAFCMRCFYKENEKGIITVHRRTNITVCSVCQDKWQSVAVIPASNLCWNFGDLEELPIAPWPRGKPNKDPFEYCRKSDHFRCFRVYVDSDFWYPHSVEEMVIWTVERERKCSFSQFIETLSRLPPEVSGGSPKQSEPVVPSPSASDNPATRAGPGTPKTTTYLQASLSQQPQSSQMNPQVSGKKNSPQPAVVSSVPGNSLNKSPRVPTASNAGLVTSPTAKLQSKTGGAPATGKPGSSNIKRVPSSPGNAVVSPTKSVSPLPVHRNATLLSQSGVSKKLDMNVANYPPLPNHPNSGFINPRSGNPQYPNSVYTQQQLNSSLVTEPMYSQGPVFVNSGAIVSPREIPQQKTHSELSNSSNLFVVGISSGHPNVANMTVVATAQNNSEIAGRPNYRIAPISYGDGLSSTSSLQPSKTVPQVFKFSDVNFKGVSDMPLPLLQGIALSMTKKMEVCRKCFYGDRTISHQDKPENVCSNGEHQWMNPIVVIPGCDLCDNEPSYKQGEFVAIPPLPPVANIKKCEQKNHHKCFAKSMESNGRLAHSVEELVIWIVESKEECSFEQYVLHKLHLHIPVSSNDISKLDSSVQPHHSPQAQVSISTIPATPEAFKPVMIKGSPATVLSEAKPIQVIFTPKDTEFTSIKDIPSELLRSVAECYHHRMLVCRICFFDSNCETLSSRKDGSGGIPSSECENGHTPWKHVIVIPASALCVSPSKYVPIPPLPKHMKHSSSSFIVCKKKEHNTCYAMSKGTNPWFPHTVEELVIWTVEREKDTSFEDVYKEFLGSFLGTGGTHPVQQQQRQYHLQSLANGTTSKNGTSYIDSVPVFNPSTEVPVNFTSGLQAPFLNLEDPIYRAGPSTGEHTATSTSATANLPSQADLQHDLFDFSNFTPTGQYSYPMPSGSVASKNPMGLGVASGMNQNTASSQTMTASDALEYFPALLSGISTTDAGGNPLSMTGNPLQPYSFANAFGMGQSFQPGGFKGQPNPAPNQKLDANQYQNETAVQNWNRVLSENPSNSFTQRLNEPLPPPTLTSQNRTVEQKDWSSTVGRTKLTATHNSLHPPGFKPTVQDVTINTVQNTTNVGIPTASAIANVESSTSNAGGLAIGAKWSDMIDTHDLDDSFGEDTYNGIDLLRMPNSEPLVLENVTKKGSRNGGKMKKKRGKKNASKPSAESARPQQNGHSSGSGNESTAKDVPASNSTEGTAENPGVNGRSLNELQHSINTPLEQGSIVHNNSTSSDLVFEKQAKLVSTAHVTMSDVITSQSQPKEARSFNKIEFELHQMPPTTTDGVLPLLPVLMPTEPGVELQLKSTSIDESNEDQSFKVSHDLPANEQQPLQLTTLERDLTTKSSLFASVMAAKASASGSVSPIIAEEGENDHITNMSDSNQGATSTQQKIGHHTDNKVGNTENVVTSVLNGGDIDEIELDYDEDTNDHQMVQAPSGNSQQPEIQVTVSDRIAVNDGVGGASGFLWKAAVRGQDLKTLFSVSCHTTCSQLVEKAEHVFRIVHIEGCTTSPMHVHNKTWESKEGEPVLQGVVIVTVGAAPPRSSERTEYQCEVQVNVGFTQPLTFKLQLTTEGGDNRPQISEPVLNGKISGPQLNGQPRSNPIPMDDASGSMPKWDLLSMSSSSSDELGVPNIEGEDLTLQHVPIEDWGCSLTDDVD